jgi:hypothetical protein
LVGKIITSYVEDEGNDKRWKKTRDAATDIGGQIQQLAQRVDGCFTALFYL